MIIVYLIGLHQIKFDEKKPTKKFFKYKSTLLTADETVVHQIQKLYFFVNFNIASIHRKNKVFF